jgi:hypothetical protein
MRALVLGAALSVLALGPAVACGPAGNPRLATFIDARLSQAQLPAADLERVTVLRAQIAELAAAGKEEAAREAEEQAMRVLGYRKVWLKCGFGSFMWMSAS